MSLVRARGPVETGRVVLHTRSLSSRCLTFFSLKKGDGRCKGPGVQGFLPGRLPPPPRVDYDPEPTDL